MAKEKPFNNPFGALKAPAPKQEAAKPAAPPPPPPKKKQQKVSVDDESAEFLAAMGAFDQVKPVKEPEKPEVVVAHAEKVAADDLESLIELSEMVLDGAELSIRGASGAVQGFDARVLERLQAGALTPAAELNVAGLAGDAARSAVERFVNESRSKKRRCVRVIGADVAVLSKARLASKVLAYVMRGAAVDLLLRS